MRFHFRATCSQHRRRHRVARLNAHPRTRCRTFISRFGHSRSPRRRDLSRHGPAADGSDEGGSRSPDAPGTAQRYAPRESPERARLRGVSSLGRSATVKASVAVVQEGVAHVPGRSREGCACDQTVRAALLGLVEARGSPPMCTSAVRCSLSATNARPSFSRSIASRKRSLRTSP